MNQSSKHFPLLLRLIRGGVKPQGKDPVPSRDQGHQGLEKAWWVAGSAPPIDWKGRAGKEQLPAAPTAFSHTLAPGSRSRQRLCPTAPIPLAVGRLEQAYAFPRPGSLRSLEGKRSRGERVVAD